MRFIDIFAGLGGFNLALSRQGHNCVFACEIDRDLQELYKMNFGLRPFGDIKKIAPRDIPRHELLCAGFPCQPFSKAGEQNGLECPKYGDLFNFIVSILRYHSPKYFILENVPNLIHHDTGKTWLKMKRRLINMNYDVDERRFSPHQFGIPQMRDRVYIVGCRGGFVNYEWPRPGRKYELSILAMLDKNPKGAKALAPEHVHYLEAWQEFLNRLPKNSEVPSFPIWSMEFGADYPFESETPHKQGMRELGKHKGAFGICLRDVPRSERMNSLPSYARTKEKEFPDWKKKFIKQNREFYLRHKNWLNDWLPSIKKFHSSYQKFEWHCKGEDRNIWNKIVQFRASGIRVRRPSASPSLIAMTTSQVPIITWEKRYMTERECANLQSLRELKYLPSSNKAFKALGNAVNADIVEKIAIALIGSAKKNTDRNGQKKKLASTWKTQGNQGICRN